MIIIFRICIAHFILLSMGKLFLGPVVYFNIKMPGFSKMAIHHSDGNCILYVFFFLVCKFHKNYFP